MSTDLALIGTDSARELAVNAERARMMAGARDALPRQYRDNPAALLVAFEFADALGVPRISALTGVHIVDGKPTASADLIGALVRKAGHKLRVKGDETYAEAVIIRADDPDFVPDPIRWDLDRARKAGLLGKKGPWQSYPGAMMRARAVTEAARMWASEALFGVIYAPEELGVDVDMDGAPIADAPRRVESEQVQQQPAPIAEPAAPAAEPVPADMAARIAASEDAEGLRKLADFLPRKYGDTDEVADLLLAIAQRIDALTAPAEPEPELTPDADVVDVEVQS